MTGLQTNAESDVDILRYSSEQSISGSEPDEPPCAKRQKTLSSNRWPPPLPPIADKPRAEFAAHHNGRLEFLGDNELGHCVTNILHKSIPDADEGELSSMKSA